MKDLLKFLTCGSVDDGKSTLIGHMLYDAKLLYADQKRALEMESKAGNRDGKPDYSLLLDGLLAEREQGITIDVAYRYFHTEKRSFIVADTPGHEEYTRNMAVGASFANLAVILVDASKGILSQTKRHARICSFMGIRHFIFVVNKMDLLEYDESVFDKLEGELRMLSEEFGYDSIYILPVSASEGDNVTKRSANMTWFEGPALLPYLEDVDVRHTCRVKQSGQEEESEKAEEANIFVMPVQRVSRPNAMFRGFQGQIESGSITAGDEVTVLPSGERAKVKEIFVADRKADSASEGQPVTVCLEREVDISRGCVLVRGEGPKVSSMCTATLLWMDDSSLVSGNNYYMKLGTKTIPATVMKVKYQVDINSGMHLPAERVHKNEIACCDLVFSEKIVFDEFKKSKALGAFLLIDRISNRTFACGVVEHSLRRSDNLTWQETTVGRKERAGLKGQTPKTFWFTGLSGSGKSALANETEKRLFGSGKHTMLLDGDNIRRGLNKNLGFKESDRIENIRRVAEVAKLMNDAGIIVLAAFISPYARDRESAKEIIGKEHFVEIYVSTSLEECERRDVKGLYRKARNGEIPNFTGINSPYEKPVDPDITVDTEKGSLEENADRLMEQLKKWLE